MSKVIICANQKGGVAKTTTTINVGIGLARMGKKVLIIDNDPQGSLTEALGYQQPDEIDTTLSNIIEWVLNEEEFDLDAGILHHKEGVDLMPANIELAGVETSLIGIMSSETVLKDYIEMIGDCYDYIVIDCSPNLGQLTLNALVAADEIIIPVQPAYLPIKGLQQLLKTISRVKRKMNHLKEDGKKYCFSTFLKHLAPEALSMTYADIHGVTRDVEKKFTLIMGIMKRIAVEKQITVSAVTSEMIHEVKTTTSVRDIAAILDYVRGKASVEQMMEEDSLEKKSMKDAGNLDTDIFDELDLDTEKLFDSFFARLTDIEKFFVLLEVHCCDEGYTKMTSGELATDDIFVSIVATDSKLKKNIYTGDIMIERPGRSSASDTTSIEMKNVEFVSDNVIRYQRRKVVTTLKSLCDGLKVSDIIGTCGVNYFRIQWDVLIQKYLIDSVII